MLRRAPWNQPTAEEAEEVAAQEAVTMAEAVATPVVEAPVVEEAVAEPVVEEPVNCTRFVEQFLRTAGILLAEAAEAADAPSPPAAKKARTEADSSDEGQSISYGGSPWRSDEEAVEQPAAEETDDVAATAVETDDEAVLEPIVDEPVVQDASDDDEELYDVGIFNNHPCR